MRKTNLNILKKHLAPTVISFFCLFLFFDGFKTFFHQDDFIQMYYSQNLKAVIDAFNIFKPAEFAFYRPIPTQLYFFITKSLFGWNPLGYHIANFIILCANIFLAYYLTKILFNKKTAVIASIIFGINTTHFAPLHAAAYVHELFLVFFALAVCLSFANYLKSRRKKYFLFSVAFFVLALMSKETAVVVPGLIFLEYTLIVKHFSPKEIVKILAVYSLILLLYLFFHYFFYGMPKSTSYEFMFGKNTLKMYFWYFIWGLSSPNILIDFLEPGLKIRPVFFEITKGSGYFFIAAFSVFIAVLILLFIKTKKKKKIFFGIFWFIFSLIPLVVFPLHKLAIEQALALFGLAVFIGNLLALSSKKICFLTGLLYVVIAVNSTAIAKKTHWVVRSAMQAKNIVEEMKKIKIKKNEKILFSNGEVKIPEYGSAKQIFLASGNGKMFPLMFNVPLKNVFFEDVNYPSGGILQFREVDSSKLLGY